MRGGGLYSIAFPPDYRQSGRFYVYYTDTAGDNQVAEFRRSPDRAAVAVRSSLRPVLSLPHPTYRNHNGGQLAFHGHQLLIGTGDGGGRGDPLENAMNIESLNGKLLRIVPVPSAKGLPFQVPRGNPFVGVPGNDAILSLGLRNPFRFSIQPQRGRPDRLLIGDVGQYRYEEVDYIDLPAARGANFGWDAREGAAAYDCAAPGCPNDGTPDPGGTVAPIFTYGHGSYATPGGPSGCSITGGVLVRNRSLPSLHRRYLFADFCEGELRSFIPALRGAIDEGPVGVGASAITSFAQTPDGSVYLTSVDGPAYHVVAR